MTFNELIDDVIMDLDEERTDPDVLEKVKKYINRGYKELSKREQLEKTKNVFVNGGKAAKPTDMIRLFHVRQDGTLLPSFVNGKYIEIETEGMVELTYNYYPDALEDLEDETITNVANDEFILNYAKWLFYLSEGMNDLAQFYRLQVDTFKPVIVTKIVKTLDVLGV